MASPFNVGAQSGRGAQRGAQRGADQGGRLLCLNCGVRPLAIVCMDCHAIVFCTQCIKQPQTICPRCQGNFKGYMQVFFN